MENSGMILLLFNLFLGTKCNETKTEILVSGLSRLEDEKVRYVPKITDSVFGCENFDNKILDCSGLVLGSTKGEEGDEAKLGGTIVTIGEIISDYDVEIDIWKIMEMGNEYMYSTRNNFCSSLENTDAPWYPIVQSMNISSCPIPISSFEVAEMSVSLDSVKDVMCHDFVGEYRVLLSIMDKTKKISCHVIEISIIEEECDE